ncbi:MAG: DUF6134 family protein [Pseudomonadota bacterium]
MTQGFSMLYAFRRVPHWLPTLMFGVALASLIMAPRIGAAADEASADELPANLYFDVTMDGKPMGYHHVEFSRDGDDILVDIDIDLRVKFAFITVFKYIHENQERWQGDTVQSLVSKTEDSGKAFAVNAVRDGELLVVEGSRGDYEVRGPLATTSYWHYETMTSNDRMLNSQKGDLLPYTLTNQGTEMITARGQEIEAVKYFLDSKIDTCIWYAADTNEWVKLEFDARGRTIEYNLVTDKAQTTDNKAASLVAPTATVLAAGQVPSSR